MSLHTRLKRRGISIGTMSPMRGGVQASPPRARGAATIAVLATLAATLASAPASAVLRLLPEPDGLDAVAIEDLPSLRWRGVHDDLSRGPLPTLETLERRIRTAAELKLNLLDMMAEQGARARNVDSLTARLESPATSARDAGVLRRGTTRGYAGSDLWPPQPGLRCIEARNRAGDRIPRIYRYFSLIWPQV